MGVLYTVLVFLCVLSVRTLGYNVDVEKVGKVLGDEGTQFGYSVAFVKSDPLGRNDKLDITLLVGSPNLTVDGIRAHGDVYSCSSSESERPLCQPMNIKDPSNACQYLKRNKTSRSPCEEDSRMGATIIVNRKYASIHGYNIDRKLYQIPLVTMCAPGWKTVNKEDNDVFEKFMFGMCLKLDENMNILPCPPDDGYSYCWPFWGGGLKGRRPIDEKGRAVFSYAVGGLAADFSSDGMSEVVGGPGVNRYRGAFRAYHKQWMVKKNWDKKSTTYYGYAIASGNFENGANLAVGNPNFHTDVYGHYGQVEMLNGETKVFGLEFKRRSTMRWCFDLVQTGDPLFDKPIEIKMQVGMKYGASLAAVDITGDKLDELLVGAPLYSDQFVESGIVFVYKVNFDSPCIIGVLTGAANVYVLRDEASYGRFGTTISSAGDLDMDGFTDIAIGAPYENGGSGAVYIYSVTRPYNYVQDEYSQRIVGKDIDTGLRSFGWSIYGHGEDVDQNGFPDLAVGAYASDKAYVFRSQPVAQVSVTMMISPKPIPLEATNLDCSLDKIALCMELKVWVAYKNGPGNDDRPIDVLLHLDADTLYKKKQNGRTRIQFRENNRSRFNETFTIKKGKELHKNYIMDVPVTEIGTRRRPEPRDPWTTVQIKGFFELEHTNGTDFSELDHILSTMTQQNITTEADFDKNCDNINDCTSDLGLKVDLYLIGLDKSTQVKKSEKVDNHTVIIVDESNQMGMTIEVTNLLNTSYRTNVSATVQAVLRRRVSQDGTIQAECKNDLFKMPTNFNCTAEEELDQNEDIRVQSNFDISRARLVTNMQTLENIQEFVNVSVIANQGNTDVNMENNVFNISIPVLIKSEIDISVDTRTSNRVRYNADPKSSRSIKIQHRYFVTNKGPSFLPKTYVNISIPHKRGGETIARVKSNSICVERGTESQVLTTVATTKTTTTDRGFTIPEPEKQRKRRSAEIVVAKEDSSTTEQKEKDSGQTRNITCGEYECIVFECKLVEMETTETKTIDLDITVAEKEIARVDGDQQVRFITNASATPPTVWFSGKVVPWDHSETESKTTLFIVESRVTEVNIWIIIGSVIGAVVILIVIIIILWKVGFLERNKKKQLQKMRQESLYKRRSRRASTMSGSKTPYNQIDAKEGE